MRLVRYYGEVPANLKGGVIALGNFDGLHLGHQAVIGEAVRLAQSKKHPSRRDDVRAPSALVL